VRTATQTKEVEVKAVLVVREIHREYSLVFSVSILILELGVSEDLTDNLSDDL